MIKNLAVTERVTFERTIYLMEYTEVACQVSGSVYVE